MILRRSVGGKKKKLKKKTGGGALRGKSKGNTC